MCVKIAQSGCESIKFVERTKDYLWHRLDRRFEGLRSVAQSARFNLTGMNTQEWRIEAVDSVSAEYIDVSLPIFRYREALQRGKVEFYPIVHR